MSEPFLTLRAHKWLILALKESMQCIIRNQCLLTIYYEYSQDWPLIALAPISYLSHCRAVREFWKRSNRVVEVRFPNLEGDGRHGKHEATSKRYDANITIDLRYILNSDERYLSHLSLNDWAYHSMNTNLEDILSMVQVNGKCHWSRPSHFRTKSERLTGWQA